MVREFKLINEKGQEFSCMDIYNYCLMTEPTGLGISYSSEYQKVGNVFIENFRTLEQGQIPATVNFLSYDNYRKFANFIESAEKLKIAYKVPYQSGVREYFKDVKIDELTKTERQENGVLSENITINCLSLWYEKVDLTYNIIRDDSTNIIRWNFVWNSKFKGIDDSEISIINEGHISALIYMEISGRVVNPRIKLLIDNEEYQTVTFNTEIAEYEKLLYCTKENEFYIEKENTDGTRESLFDLDVIDFNNDNVIRIPKNRSCKLQVLADNEISDIKAVIYIYYKIV